MLDQFFETLISHAKRFVCHVLQTSGHTIFKEITSDM